MKLHKQIFSIGFLLFSGSAYTYDSQSVVPWSLSSALSSATSTVASWSSSALATVSAWPTEAKIAIGGGLAVLTGDYFFSRYLDRKYKIEDQEETSDQLRSFLDQSDLVRKKDPRLCKMTSVAPCRRYSVIDDQSEILQQRTRSHSATSIDAHLIQSRSHRPGLPEDIEERIAQMAASQSNNEVDVLGRSRSNSTVSSALSTTSVTSLISSDSRESSSVASSRGISSDESEARFPVSIIQRRLSGSAVPIIDPRDTGRTRSQSVSDLDTDRELDEPSGFISSAQEISLDAQRYINLLKAQAASKQREEELQKQQKRDDEEAESYGYVPLDKGDCASLRHQYVHQGQRIMQRFKRGERVPVTLKELLAVTAYHHSRSNDESRVVIKNLEVRDCVVRFWNEENKEQGLLDHSTYLSSNGTLVMSLPKGALRQDCILPDGVSHLELSPGHDGVTVILHREAPTMEASWENFRRYALASAHGIGSHIAQFMSSSLQERGKQIGCGLSQRADRYGCYLREAAASGNKAMIAWSLANGADVNAPVKNNDCVGLRPLHCAAMNGQREATQLLLRMGADPCLVAWHEERAGVLPLHLAVARGDYKMSLLLWNKSNSCNTCLVTLDSGDKVSAFDLAKRYGHVSIVRAFARELYPAIYDDMYGDRPKLAYIDRTWNMFGRNTPAVVAWKLKVLNCAYEELQKELQGDKKLKGRKIADIDHAELQGIKGWLDAQLTILTQKSSGLKSVLDKGQSSQEDFIRGMDDECQANKLSFAPEAYYQQLGYITWQEGVNAPFVEVESRLDERAANQDGLSDDKAHVYRQLGYFFRDANQKRYFDHFLKFRNQSQEEKEGFGIIEVNKDGVPGAQDAEGCFMEACLSVDAGPLAQKYVEITSCDALMYCKEMQTVMQRELNKRVQHDENDRKEEEK